VRYFTRSDPTHGSGRRAKKGSAEYCEKIRRIGADSLTSTRTNKQALTTTVRMPPILRMPLCVTRQRPPSRYHGRPRTTERPLVHNSHMRSIISEPAIVPPDVAHDIQGEGSIRYDIDAPALADEFVARLGLDLQDESCPPEIQQLGRTIVRWRHQIAAWHQSRVSNGPTEAINNLVKRIKRVAFGFRRFAHYRIRALLYAGRPNWHLLASVTPR
jgi:hypothetical protein